MKYGPGKFEGNGNYANAAQYLYSLSLDSSLEDDIGSSDELGWYGKFEGKIKGRGPFFAVISENSQGFVDVEWFESHDELETAWLEIQTEYERFEAGIDN